MYNIDNKPTLAIIVPCYNESSIIQESSSKLFNILNNLINRNIISENSYISFVDDGSRDSLWDKLIHLSENNSHFKCIRLLYNTGHQNAIFCGLKENEADIYITIDCDLQDDTNVIEDMIKKYKENNLDIVYSIRKNRFSDNLLKRIPAQIYYKILHLIGIKSLDNCADFRLVSNNVVKFLRQLNETNLYLRGLLFNYNFKYDIVYYTRTKRIGGTPKYNFKDSFDLAIKGITNFSLRPIRIIFITGFCLFIFSILLKSLLILMTAINLMSLGIIGEYLGHMFNEVKKRPNYIVIDKTNNF